MKEINIHIDRAQAKQLLTETVGAGFRLTDAHSMPMSIDEFIASKADGQTLMLIRGVTFHLK